MARHAPGGLRDISGRGELLTLDSLQGLPITAACGIGNPTAFAKTLLSLGAVVKHFHALPDHAEFTPAQMDELLGALRSSGARALVVTEKDAMKLEPFLKDADVSVWALEVKLEFTAGQAEFEQVVQGSLKKAAQRLGK
jgi:tetraacyldisaccharide-1-P 4'-kinase